MDIKLKQRKPKAGLLLIGSPRFRNLSGPKRGSYGEKKEKVAAQIVDSLSFLDLTYTGIVYERGMHKRPSISSLQKKWIS